IGLHQNPARRRLRHCNAHPCCQPMIAASLVLNFQRPRSRPMQFAPLLTLGLLFGLATPALAQTATDVWTHAFTMTGEPKYPADYTHLDYANVDAPVTGTARLGQLAAFDTVNPVLPKAERAHGIGLVYQALTTPSRDELHTYDVQLAESLKIAPAYGAVTFRI